MLVAWLFSILYLFAHVMYMWNLQSAHIPHANSIIARVASSDWKFMHTISIDIKLNRYQEPFFPCQPHSTTFMSNIYAGILHEYTALLYFYQFYCFLQGQHKAFTAIPIALLRTFSMMLGEMDFLNTFVNPHFCGVEDADYELGNEVPSSLSGSNGYGGGIGGTSPRVCMGGDERKLPHPISSFLMLGIFMVFMPILLMNLLIGLAVGDIESVRRNAQLKRLAMQVRDEKLLFSA